MHRFDKHFYEHEVFKTGQYRDHPVEDIVDRCFVMFVTRYHRGRPRYFPTDKQIYVCDSRYNESKHTFNKIKTWTSCFPDEVRDKDYVMDLFQQPRKMKKQPSPIAYLLSDEQKESDELPKPHWGADNAPPKIGAVHRRPRDPKVSARGTVVVTKSNQFHRTLLHLNPHPSHLRSQYQHRKPPHLYSPRRLNNRTGLLQLHDHSRARPPLCLDHSHPLAPRT